jgi:hypothetical protein
VNVKLRLLTDDPQEPLTRLAKSVDPQAILSRLDNGQKLMFKDGKARSIHDALEHRLLDPLAESLADLRDLAEASSARCCIGRHIVCHHQLHLSASLQPALHRVTNGG